VRDGRWQAVDQENLAREIEGLAQRFDKLDGAMHAAHAPVEVGSPRHPALAWRVQSVQPQRQAVADLLAQNPGLAPRVPGGDRALLSQGARRSRQRRRA
jgi:hypothetical protein